jgi:hypothetical protein
MAGRVPGCVAERSLSSGAFSAVHQEYEYTPAGHSSQCDEEDAPGSENNLYPGAADRSVEDALDGWGGVVV